ncbi:MAG: type IV pilus assembly protein PilM [Candidatus Pacebacteria bacterium]|nr:type IV pilus assembly protein PilM [Candidatus Paceibacterota bacterium]
MAFTLFGKTLSPDLKFWQKDQRVIGIDIGSSSVKIVQLKKEKEKAILETYGELATGPYANRPIGQNAQLSEEAAVSMIMDLAKESGAGAKDAIVSIPVKSSFLTTIKIPLVEGGKNMNEMIGFEARKYIPVPLNEVDLDWWVLDAGSDETGEEEQQLLSSGGKTEKKQMVEVLLAAIQREVIMKYQHIISKAGMKVKAFEIEVFSEWRSSIFRQTAPFMLIDLGASSTKISVIDKGALRMTHAVDKGGQAITTAIANSLKISFERAEEMKQEIGLSPRPEYREFVNVMETVLSFIFAESKQMSLAYGRKYGNSVSKIVLIGGGALLKGITDMAVKNLGVEVSLADPFSKTEYPLFLQESIKQISPVFAVATGLAMRDL